TTSRFARCVRHPSGKSRHRDETRRAATSQGAKRQAGLQPARSCSSFSCRNRIGLPSATKAKPPACYLRLASSPRADVRLERSLLNTPFRGQTAVTLTCDRVRRSLAPPGSRKAPCSFRTCSQPMNSTLTRPAATLSLSEGERERVRGLKEARNLRSHFERGLCRESACVSSKTQGRPIEADLFHSQRS